MMRAAREMVNLANFGRRPEKLAVCTSLQSQVESMTNRKPKLELNWIEKKNRPKLEPRILLEDEEKSYHAPHRITDRDIFNNRLIFGDNLMALKARTGLCRQSQVYLH